jgi:hypothetical protein
MDGLWKIVEFGESVRLWLLFAYFSPCWKTCFIILQGCSSALDSHTIVMGYLFETWKPMSLHYLLADVSVPPLSLKKEDELLLVHSLQMQRPTM